MHVAVVPYGLKRMQMASALLELCEITVDNTVHIVWPRRRGQTCEENRVQFLATK